MFANHHSNAPRAREQRYVNRFVAKANGAEDRKAAAEFKRLRKAEKRVHDATNSEIGQMKAREVLA